MPGVFIRKCNHGFGYPRAQRYFRFGRYIIIPKEKIGHNQKELHWSPRVDTSCLGTGILRVGSCRDGVQKRKPQEKVSELHFSAWCTLL